MLGSGAAPERQAPRMADAARLHQRGSAGPEHPQAQPAENTSA